MRKLMETVAPLFQEEQPVVEANTTEAVEELHSILDHLEELGEQARNIVAMLDRG